MNQVEFVAALASLRPASTFLALKAYRNAHSEVGDYSIVFHMSYKSALERSLVALANVVPEGDLEAQALQELRDGYQGSLDKMAVTPIEEVDDAYTRFYDEGGAYIKGVKMHTETCELHLYGLVVHKRILVPGSYPKSNKRALTMTKDKLRKLCPVNKFRQFKLLPSHVEHISVQELRLLPPE